MTTESSTDCYVMGKKLRPDTAYWYVSDSGTVELKSRWDGGRTDYARLQVGNVFHTEDAANEAASVFKDYLKSVQARCSDLVLNDSIFSHSACPAWANYAAVDANGEAFWFATKPYIDADSDAWNGGDVYQFIPGKFRCAHWRSSLVERHPLPSWCTSGDIVWCIETGKYTDVMRINETEVELGDSYVPRQSISEQYREARTRPFNNEEMMSLFGKIVEHPGGSFMITGVDLDDDATVFGAGEWYNATDLVRKCFKIDGEFCYVREHKDESGRWVE